MRGRLAVMGLAVGLCASLGCGSGRAQTRAPERLSGESADASGAPVYAPIGILACDAYLERLQSCLLQQPSEVQASMRQGVSNARAAWSQAAAQPGSRSQLEEACESALATLKRLSFCGQ